MTIKLFQLNMLAGRFIDRIINYLGSNDFDVIQLQEVANGHWFKSFKSNDNFAQLNHALSSRYQGELAPTMKLLSDPNSYFANATFLKKSLPLLDKKIISIKKIKPAGVLPGRHIQNFPRNALDLRLSCDQKIISFINTHLTWGPTPDDTKYKLVQAQRLYRYLRSLGHPFILSGDFNLIENTQIIRMFEEVAINLNRVYHITNTLNPHVHRVQKLFPQGLAVDYIFTSPQVKVRRFSVVDQPDLSDHYGLFTEVEI